MHIDKSMNRGWQEYWDWGRDKPAKQLDAVRCVLEAAGVRFTGLRSCEDDPPDCEASIDGQCSGIEHSELLCQKTLEANIRDLRKRAANAPLKLTGPIAEWPRESLIEAIQARIDEKDVSHKSKYERYALVLVTAEMNLYRARVEECLAGAKFKAKLINDVYFGLDYHPADPLTGKGGGIPVFRLCLIPR